MKFWEYLKKEEPSRENEEARKRIYRLHQQAGSLIYIEFMEKMKEQKGSMEVEFVRGELKEGDSIYFYDHRGEKSGCGEVIELLIGKQENKSRFSEQGNKGRILFHYEEPVTEEFWKSQYVKDKK